MKPCRDCIDSRDNPDGYGRCKTFYCCTKYIDWQEEVKLMQEDDPRVERGVDYHIDDREV